ncbi:MAG: hypothetical protein AABO58_05000 [Acidobacteriota bacterium]
MPNSFPYKSQLEFPVIGLEAEFKVFVDGEEAAPESVWRTPAGLVDRPLLKRTSKSLQLPTGGALYFDGGVLEVVTPVIEIAPQCTARVVRSLWEQIGFVREQLDRWEARTGRTARLQAFSCHVNISFELPREERGRDRTIQKLAVLLAHLLPVPAIVVGANRRSTGVGVRPRRERIEVTIDFTPDPGLMAATVALIVGVARDVIAWPSYRLGELDARGVARPAGVAPGRHPSRKGWITKDFHFPRNPFAGDPDAATWRTIDGRTMSLRAMARETVMIFRDAIRRVSDPFSYRLLLSIVRGETPSLLDLDDRPAAYDDVGRTTRWGSVLPELHNFRALMRDAGATGGPRRRRDDLEEKLAPPWSDERYRRLARSAYEKVFLALGTRSRFHVDGEVLTPVGVKGWYHSVLRGADGTDRLVSIDQLRGCNTDPRDAKR